jgi:hypothetical protein
MITITIIGGAMTNHHYHGVMVQLASILSSFSSKQDKLTLSGDKRQVIAEAPIYEETKGVKHNRHLILFNDMIVCARKHKEAFRILWYVELLNSQISELKSML